MAERIRKHIVFYGSVQGVGFRYRTYYAARENGVAGWIMNRYDGAVEAEFEGEEKSIDEVMIAVERGRFVHISSMEVRTIPVHNDYTFEILD